MVRSSFALIALLAAAPAFAQELGGCDTLRWPLDQERALLAKPSPVVSGAEAPQPPAAMMVTLVPLADAKLPLAPSRTPRYSNSYAGFVRVPALSKAGTYRFTLSHSAWVDVVQDGHRLKLAAFTGATGCESVAKSVKFDLVAAPFVIELSGASAPAVGLAVTPD